MMYAGIDGCRAGWFVVRLHDDDTLDYAIHPSITTAWEAVAAAKRVLIDMPIGLSETGERGVEDAARRLLGERSSSVFVPPARAALAAPTYAEASLTNAEVCGKKLSKQTWNIMPKIREVDAFLQARPSLRERLLESHPELVFAAFNGRPVAFSKKTGFGFTERLTLLTALHGAARRMVYAARLDYGATDLADDDILDGLALALAARRDDLVTVPETPENDALGLPMQIVMPPLLPPARSITRMNHVQVTIPKGAEAAGRAFYCDVLGLMEIAKPVSLAGRGGFWVLLGDQQVHIGTEDGVDRHATKAHIAYEVPDITYWRERLTSAGCTLLESIPLPGCDRFETRDPFGNRIEIISPQT